MRRAIAVVAIFSFGFLTGRLWDCLTVQAQGEGRGGATPCGNGDVNGDGEIDISDGVYILSNLFTGGPDPVPIESALPATGQTKCYDEEGNEIACQSFTYPGQDGEYQAGCPTEGRFVDNEDGTVTDTCTGLMWQQDTADVSGNGSIGNEDSIHWQEALLYCESLEFAGHDDWRLPNVRELGSIINSGRSMPASHPVFKTRSNFYWSSTSYRSEPDHAWEVLFYDGDVETVAKDSLSFVRAVRGGL